MELIDLTSEAFKYGRIIVEGLFNIYVLKERH